MSKAKNLTAHQVGKDMEGAKRHLDGPGWYAVDDNLTAQMGPYSILKECEKAIRREIDLGR